MTDNKSGTEIKGLQLVLLTISVSLGMFIVAAVKSL